MLAAFVCKSKNGTDRRTDGGRRDTQTEACFMVNAMDAASVMVHLHTHTHTPQWDGIGWAALV